MPNTSNRLRAVDELAAPDLWADIEERASTAGVPTVRPPAPSGLRRWVAAAVALAVFSAGGFVAVRVLLRDGATELQERPAADPWAEVAPGWTRLPDPLFSRSDVVAVWAGDRLILWGGGTDYTANFFGDGAVFDPATGSWTPMADGPLRARADARAVWTGGEVLIWGGYGNPGPFNDGAAYDPATDDWRPLPEAPWAISSPAAYAWTGSELVIFGSSDRRLDEVRDGVAYDPGTDRWRPIASAPLALNLASAVWTGAEVIVFGSELNNRNVSETRWAQGMAWNPDTDAWRVLPEHPISPQASWANWTGTEMLVWDYETGSALYDPGTDTWREPNPMPMEFSECYPYSVETNDSVFAWFCGQMGSFDIAEDRWEAVEPGPPPASKDDPNSYGSPVGAGEVVVLFVAGRQAGGELSQMWAYRAP